MRDTSQPHSIVTLRWVSRALKLEKTVSVLVPPAASAQSPHAVLVLLHGYGGNRNTWIDKTRLTRYLVGKNLLVVMPESGRRWFINDHSGFRYEDYLITELLPFIKDSYDVAKDRAGWAIGGFSMGGAAALMQALRYPRAFSAVLSHAGAFEAPLRRGDPYESLRQHGQCLMPTTEVHERVWGPYGSVTRRSYDPYQMIRNWPVGAALHVYADVGSDDHERIIRMNRNTAAALRAVGIQLTYAERDGAHDLMFLNCALRYSLEFAAERLVST